MVDTSNLTVTLALKPWCSWLIKDLEASLQCATDMGMPHELSQHMLNAILPMALKDGVEIKQSKPRRLRIIK